MENRQLDTRHNSGLRGQPDISVIDGIKSIDYKLLNYELLGSIDLWPYILRINALMSASAYDLASL